MQDFEKFYNIALRFLSYRPRSEKEVRDKLVEFARKRNKKVATTETQNENETQNFSASKKLSDSVVAGETSIVDRVINKLKEQKFLNDEEFVKWWIESRLRFKPRSLRLIKLELKQKGISDEIIESGIGNQELGIENDLEQAKKLVEKRIGRVKNLSNKEIYQKLGSYLARRGFDWDTIKHSIDELIFK